MRVAVLCEYSGIVRDAFIRKGHDAISCDMLPTESPGPHIQGDLFDYDWSSYDLIIAHPPCTYLAYSGARYWNDPGRKEKREEALKFFINIYNIPVPRICIENPHGYARIAFRQPDQEIHPYFFGDPFMKRTCLWLRGLTPLVYRFKDDLFGKRTSTDKPRPSWVRKDGNKQYFCSTISRKNRAKERSKFWPGIANAMADQWG